MKIALVHDCFREYGGAERVVEVMHELWPEAPVYTSFVDWKGLGIHKDRFADWNIKTSWVQHRPFLKKYISPLRFLIPSIWKSFDFSAFDVVVSSSGWFISRGIIVKKPTVHICYIHHPPRNMYGYATGSTIQKYWIVRVYSTIVNFFLRHYDFDAAKRVDYFIANSKETARRVEKFYRRESTVIYPPINVSRITYHGSRKKQYFLSVGRLSWAKRVDLAIEACNTLKLPLKIVGAGSEEHYLKSIAGPTIEFLGAVSDQELDVIYAHAKALIFSARDEDFGMVPVEAMAHGIPVLALQEGGVKETIIDGVTGIVFRTPDVSSLCTAIQKFETISKNKQWARECIKQAAKFSTEEFKKQLKSFVDSHQKIPS